MANSELRMRIVTSLDNAGIKATKEQIDSIQQSIQNLNKGGSNNDGSLLGNMNGQLGRLAKRAVGIVGVLKTLGGLTNEVMKKATVDGQSWGKAFYEGSKSFLIEASFSIAKIFGIDFQAMLDEATTNMQKNVQQIQQSVSNALAKFSQEQNAIQANQTKAHQEKLKQIDIETNAYKRQLDVVNGIRGTYDTAQKNMLERQRFEDVAVMRSEGATDEEIEQLNKAWDVRIAQETAESQLRQIAQNSAQFELGVENTQKKIDANKEAIKQQWELQKEYQRRMDDIAETPVGERSDLQRKLLSDQKDLMQKSRIQVSQLMKENRAMLDSISPEMVAARRQDFALQAANIRASSGLEIDKLAYAYDDFVDKMTGQPLDLNLQGWSDELLENSKSSYNALVQTMKNTEGLPALSEKIDILLQLK